MQNPPMGRFTTKFSQYTSPPLKKHVTQFQAYTLPPTKSRPTRARAAAAVAVAAEPAATTAAATATATATTAAATATAAIEPAAVPSATVPAATIPAAVPAAEPAATITAAEPAAMVATDQSRTYNHNNAKCRDKDTESTDDIAEIFLELATRKPSVVSMGDSTQWPIEHRTTREATLKELLARQIQEQKIMIEDKVRTLHHQRLMMDNNIRQIHHQMMMVDHEILMAQYHRNMLEQRLKVVSDGIEVPDVPMFQYQPQAQPQVQPGAQPVAQSQQTGIGAFSTGSESHKDYTDVKSNSEPGRVLPSECSNSDADKNKNQQSVKADGAEQDIRKTKKKPFSKKPAEKKIRWTAEYTSALSRSMLKFIGMHESGVVPKEVRQKIVDDLNEQFPNVNFGINTVGAELARIIKVTKTKFLPVYQTSNCGVNFAKKKLVMKSSRKLTMREYDEKLDVMSRQIAKRLKIPTPSVLSMFYDNCEIFMNVSMFLMGDIDYFIQRGK